MKTTFLRLLAVLVVATSLTNCATAYDEYGNPQTVVTPEGALLGAAAVGLLAYGLANDGDHDHHHRRYHGRSRYRHGYRY